jgi:hypothetical protein
MMEKLISVEEWSKRKDELVEGIESAAKRNESNKEVYDIMKELLQTAKLRTSITEYYEQN